MLVHKMYIPVSKNSYDTKKCRAFVMFFSCNFFEVQGWFWLENI